MKRWLTESLVLAAVLATAIVAVAASRSTDVPPRLHAVAARPGTMTDAQGRAYALLFEVWPVRGDSFCRVVVQIRDGAVSATCGAAVR